MIVPGDKIYTVNSRQRTLVERFSGRLAVRDTDASLIGNHIISGIHPDDFAVDLFDLTEDGVTNERFLISTRLRDNYAHIVPSGRVEEDPRLYATSEMAQAVLAVTDDEIAQFGLTNLARHIRQRFPNIK